jgi:UDP-N-acetylmuramoylalanine--D-glutamate ligase
MNYESRIMGRGDVKSFFEICPCPIIGVMGTKGKSTTVGLIYEMLRLSGKDVYLSGLEGEYDFGFLDKLKPQSVVVLELSSSQLQDRSKSPHIAVMLGVAGEHFDDEGEMGRCVDAMRNVLRFQGDDDFAVLNRDYPAANESDVYTGAQVFFVSCERGVDEGCFVRDDMVVVKGIGGDTERVVIDLKKIFLKGKEMQENVCAAVAASILGGATIGGVRKALVSFRGLD